MWMISGLSKSKTNVFCQDNNEIQKNLLVDTKKWYNSVIYCSKHSPNHDLASQTNLYQQTKVFQLLASRYFSHVQGQHYNILLRYSYYRSLAHIPSSNSISQVNYEQATISYIGGQVMPALAHLPDFKQALANLQVKQKEFCPPPINMCRQLSDLFLTSLRSFEKFSPRLPHDPVPASVNCETRLLTFVKANDYCLICGQPPEQMMAFYFLRIGDPQLTLRSAHKGD